MDLSWKRPGIYVICSLIDDRCYVGGAKDILARMKNHKWNLQQGTHCNPKLQNFYNKYGNDSLEFMILEFCKLEVLVEREQYFMDTLLPEFNIYPKARSPLGHKCSEETRRKISKSLKERYSIPENRARIIGFTGSHSKESRAKMRASALGRIHSEISRAKISLSLRGRPSPTKGCKLSDEHKAKLRDASKKLRHSDETKQKIRLAHLGKRFTDEHRQNIRKSAIGRVISEEAKKKISLASKRMWTLERRMQHAERMRRYHAKRRSID